MRSPFFAICVCTIAALTASSPGAQAQAYPRKPVTVIVPNGVGGPYDGAARSLAQALAQALGQPFVVDNRPAGSGIAGAVAAAKAAPDGYTLLSTGSGNYSLYPAMKPDLPYDPPREYAPIMRLGVLDAFIMVNPSVPANSLRELFDLAKAKPATITWGDWGTTSPSNMYVQWLKRARGIEFYGVPYKIATQALNAGVSGETQVTVFAQGQVMPLVKAGKFRVLASTGSRRSSLMPDIPTLKESGTGFDLDLSLWIGLFAPAGTPRDILARLNSEVGTLLRDRNYTSKALLALGFQPDEPASMEDFAEYLKRDRKTYDDLIRLTGIKEE